jgi:hypothetical protein
VEAQAGIHLVTLVAKCLLKVLQPDGRLSGDE